jgi:hypothetical protein
MPQHLGNVVSKRAGSSRKAWPALKGAPIHVKAPPLSPLLLKLVPICFVLGAGGAPHRTPVAVPPYATTRSGSTN